MSSVAQPDGWGMDEDFTWHRFDGATLTARCSAAISMIRFRHNDPPVPRAAISASHSVANGGSHCSKCVSQYVQETGRLDYQEGVEPVEQLREGWASTAPGHTKYHHYGADGQSKCSYQKGTGTALHFAPDPKQLTPAECCSSCDLHILKAQQASALLAPAGDGLQMRWASIGTPGPPYHFWGDNGAKVCTFEGEHRPRYFYPSEATPTPAERCPRCWNSLRNLATHRGDFAAHLPAAAAVPITPAALPLGSQLTLF